MDVTVACGAGCVAGLATLYRFARPRFSVQVNCHFCNKNSRVPYKQANCFNCPHCEQYNGWNTDGDYNKELDMVESETQYRYVRDQNREEGSICNGLCRSCNLNQELKIAQLARFPKDGPELDEYTEYLEKVYRLCPECEDIVAIKLGEQNRELADKLLQFKLEQSRLNPGVLIVKRCSWLPYVHCVLAIAVFSCLQDYNQFHLPDGIKEVVAPVLDATRPMQLIVSNYLDTILPHVSVSEVIAPYFNFLSLPPLLVSFVVLLIVFSLFMKSCFNVFLYVVLLAAYCTSVPHILQLTLAGAGVILAVMAAPPIPHNAVVISQGNPKLRESFQMYQTICQTAPEFEDTLTQDLLDNSNESDLPSRPPSPRPSLQQTPRAAPAPLSVTSSLPPTTAPLRTCDEFSFIHEFATEQDDDCDLSSLSLGEVPAKRTSKSPFSINQYSPCSPTNSLFSPSQPLISPSKLTNTSWVAGGYWTPPSQGLGLGQPLSRTSSHSSGFVSGSPSLVTCPSPAGSVNNFCSSPPFSPLHNPYSVPNYPQIVEAERFSVLSEPTYQFPRLPPHARPYAASVAGPKIQHVSSRRPTLDDRLSDVSMEDRHSQLSQMARSTCSQTSSTSKPGWSLTITITPTGLVLAMSIAVNVALAVLWFRQGIESF